VSRQPDFSSTPSPAASRLRGELGLVVLSLAIAVACGAAAYRARAEAAEATAREATARRDLAAQQARLRAAASAGTSDAAAAGASPRRVVTSIAGVLPADARLTRLAIDYEGQVTTEMLVDSRRASAWDRLLERMERSPDFAEVAPGPEERDAEMRTTLRARWTGGER
jgi:hypothetical protein